VAKIKVDMRGVKSGFDALPIGSYAAEVEKVEQTISKQQKPMLKFTYNITHDGFEGRKAFGYASLQADALFNLHEFMLASGYADEEELDNELEFDDQDFLGFQVAVVMVPYKRDNGEMGTSCDAILPVEQATGPSGQPLPSGEVETSAPEDVASIFSGMQAAGDE
jgi:hypothetical protein